MICVYYQPHQTDTMTKNTDISRCIPTVLIIWIRAEASVMRTQILPSSVSQCLSVSSEILVLPTHSLWHQTAAGESHPAAHTEMKQAAVITRAVVQRLRTTVMWLKPTSDITVVYDENSLSSDCRALWVSHSDAVWTRTSLRKKLLHLHPIRTVHSNTASLVTNQIVNKLI